MQKSFDRLVAQVLLTLVVAVLVIVPFHALLTVSISSLVNHYVELRLWKEVLLVLMLTGSIWLLFRDRKLRLWIWQNPLLKTTFILIGLYFILHLLFGGFVLLQKEVTLTALGYGLISNLRFLLFFQVCVLTAYYFGDWFISHWQRLLLWPAAIVIGLGLLQFLVLPADFLKHFGYSSETIKPFIAVDQKSEFARVQSTLRGPNPLGAYLVIVVTVLAGLFFVRKKQYIRIAAALFAATVVLYGTYSRSAWIGAVGSVALLAWILSKRNIRKWLIIAGAGIFLFGSVTVYIFRNNDYVQNVIFHTDESSKSAVSSNENRANAISNSAKDLLYEPLGRGPGTAGPASVHNDNNARISENYFLQIGQEVGLAGLGLFLAINTFVGMMLWQARRLGLWPVALLASLVGITLVNLLSHAWADDTLAYIWWGIAGLAAGASLLGNGNKKDHA